MCDLSSIGGVIPAMLTCFDGNGDFDSKAQRALTDFLIDSGVGALYLTGSTGEAFLMEEKVRKEVVETVIDEAEGRVPVIVHVGDIGTKKTMDYARHADASGAAAISSVPPFYWKFKKDEIVSYYRDVSESVSIPMIVYNIALAGLVDFNTIKELAALENVKGIKYTATTHNEILRIKDEIGEDFTDFRDEHREDEFFFHKMRSFIYLECITEIFPVSPYADYSAFPVMVLRPEKSEKSVPASVLRTVLQGFTAQSPVFPQNPEREIGLLPVSRLRPVNPFEKLFYSGYQSDESEISEIYGSVYGRRYENMRQTALPCVTRGISMAV